MKKSLLTLLLSSCFALLFAQKHTEISFDLPNLSYSKAIELTFERQMNDRFSILSGVNYRFRQNLNYKTGENITYVGSDSTKLTQSFFDIYNAQFLSIFGELRYYWTPKNGMDRFYTGLGLFAETLIFIEKGYPGNTENRSDDTITLNIPLGYKFVVKDKIIIDLGVNIHSGLRFTKEFATGENVAYYDFNMLLNGRVGYRF